MREASISFHRPQKPLIEFSVGNDLAVAVDMARGLSDRLGEISPKCISLQDRIAMRQLVKLTLLNAGKMGIEI